MAHINRRFIDKHWFVFVLRGGLGAVFGLLLLFGGMGNYEMVISTISVFLLGMGIIDALSALYGSAKKSGWFNSVVDALIDVAAALALLFATRGDLVLCLSVVAIYVIVSGVIDILHGFLSTVDPTDRFIRVLVGVIGCVMGFVILNSGSFELMTFLRFFGVYMMIVGVTSLIYGVHNRAQKIEDTVARKEAAQRAAKARKNAGKAVAAKTTKTTTSRTVAAKKPVAKKSPVKKPTSRKK